METKIRMPRETVEAVKAALAKGRKIEAIKLVREYVGLGGLKEAKDWLEAHTNPEDLEAGVEIMPEVEAMRLQLDRQNTEIQQLRRNLEEGLHANRVLSDDLANTNRLLEEMRRRADDTVPAKEHEAAVNRWACDYRILEERLRREVCIRKAYQTIARLLDEERVEMEMNSEE